MDFDDRIDLIEEVDEWNRWESEQGKNDGKSDQTEHHGPW